MDAILAILGYVGLVDGYVCWTGRCAEVGGFSRRFWSDDCGLGLVWLDGGVLMGVLMGCGVVLRGRVWMGLLGVFGLVMRLIIVVMVKPSQTKKCERKDVVKRHLQW